MKKMNDKQWEFEKKGLANESNHKTIDHKKTNFVKKTIKTPTSDNIQEHKRYRNKLNILYE